MGPKAQHNWRCWAPEPLTTSWLEVRRSGTFVEQPMSTTSIQLESIRLPAFGRSRLCPEIPTELYRLRLAQSVERMQLEKIQTLVVYADRGHSASMQYLTGFDPRFEESLLLWSSEGAGKLLVGNECMGYLPPTRALGLDVELFQELSLM